MGKWIVKPSMVVIVTIVAYTLFWLVPQFVLIAALLIALK